MRFNITFVSTRRLLVSVGILLYNLGGEYRGFYPVSSPVSITSVMAFVHCLFSLLIFQALSLCINIVHSSPPPIFNLSNDKFIKLHAARKSSNLLKRDNKIQLSSTVELRYIDGKLRTYLLCCSGSIFN
jgi:hypothetical protein